jgi:hypothetical protein
MGRREKIVVSFTNLEEWALDQLAHRRNDGKIINGVKSRKVSEFSELAVNLYGLRGEYAVAKYLGLDLDTRTSLAGDGGVTDLRAGNKRLQVKFNTYPNGDFYIKSPSTLEADFGLLTVPLKKGDPMGPVVIAGWISCRGFANRRHIRNYGYVDNWAVYQSEMKPPQSLRALLHA